MSPRFMQDIDACLTYITCRTRTTYVVVGTKIWNPLTRFSTDLS